MQSPKLHLQRLYAIQTAHASLPAISRFSGGLGRHIHPPVPACGGGMGGSASGRLIGDCLRPVAVYRISNTSTYR